MEDRMRHTVHRIINVYYRISELVRSVDHRQQRHEVKIRHFHVKIDFLIEDLDLDWERVYRQYDLNSNQNRSVHEDVDVKREISIVIVSDKIGTNDKQQVRKINK